MSLHHELAGSGAQLQFKTSASLSVHQADRLTPHAALACPPAADPNAH